MIAGELPAWLQQRQRIEQMPNGALMNGTVSREHDLSTETLLQALKPLLDPTADAEVPANVEEAALDAVGRLGSQPSGSLPVLWRVPLSCTGTWLPWHLAEQVCTPLHRCRDACDT